MIGSTINQLAGLLNQYLKRSFDLSEDIVVVSNILDQDGSIVQHVNNKVIALLVNIQKDNEAYKANFNSSGSARAITSYPPIYLNLYVMFVANFSGNNYPEALKFISKTIGFFQRCPVFDHQNTPELDKNIDKLVLDLESLGINDLSNLWSILSGKYLPSVLYKVRMVAIDTGDIKSQVSMIQELRSSVN
jgi:hypothetical protein